MSTTSSDDRRARAFREAADWIVMEDRGLTSAEQAALRRWLDADPLHREAYRHRKDQWEALSIVADWRPEHGDQPDPDLLAPRTHRVRWLAPLSIAAAAALVVGLSPRAAQWLAPDAGTPAQTAAMDPLLPHERRYLIDGSVVDLAAQASIEVVFTPERRTVRLLRGSAHFDVAHDPSRPFVVEVVERVEVRAVGTAFDVRLASDQVDVRVTEGKVQVQQTAVAGSDSGLHPPLLVAGQRLVAPLHFERASIRIEQADNAPPPASAQPAWYEFENTPLGKVIEEFNRHGSLRVSVEDEALLAMPVYVSFSADNLESFLTLLEASGELKARRTKEGIRLYRTR